MTNITIELLRDVFRYDEETGDLIWKFRPRDDFTSQRGFSVWNKRCSGAKAGWSNDGYRVVKVLGKKMQAHRVIWAIYHGKFPSTIDHINGNRSDNRIANLREVSVAENNRNLRVRKDNRTGVTGVYPAPRKGAWRATIAFEGKDFQLGTFNEFSSAVEARKAAEIKFGYHENHGRRA